MCPMCTSVMVLNRTHTRETCPVIEKAVTEPSQQNRDVGSHGHIFQKESLVDASVASKLVHPSGGESVDTVRPIGSRRRSFISYFDGKALEIPIILHVIIDSLLNDLSALCAILFNPTRIVLSIRFLHLLTH